MQILTIIFEATGYLMGVLMAFALIATLSGAIIAWAVQKKGGISEAYIWHKKRTKPLAKRKQKTNNRYK